MASKKPSEFLSAVVTEIVHRLTCDGPNVRGCDGAIEEDSPESCAIRAQADNWHIESDGSVYCEACNKYLDEEQRIEDGHANGK